MSFKTHYFPAFAADTLARLVITRNGADDLFVGYVNGIEQISFSDSGLRAFFSEPDSIINFFIDDNEVSGESSAGLVDRIALYDGPLSRLEVADLSPASPAVPEPGSVLAALGLAGLSIASRRRRN